MSRPKKSKQIFVHRQGKTQRFTVTVKLACGKEIVAAAEYSKSFGENDQCAYQERQQSLMILIIQSKII